MRKFFMLALATLFVPGALAAETDVVGLYLTWQRDPARTMTVNWVNLYEHTTTNVFYRELGQTNWSMTQGTRHVVKPSTYQVRRVELTGLKPDTDYQFIVADKAPTSDRDIQRFRTMPAELQKPLRFVAGGDMMHSREMADAMNHRAGRLDPDFALLGGDYAYGDGYYATRWFDWMQSWTKHARGRHGRLIPMVQAIGNHEVRGGQNGKAPMDAPYFYGFFALPENRSYYALDFGKYLSLIILDTEHTHPIVGAQTDWLGQALSERTEQQFIFPCYHWPAYGTTKAPKGKLPHEDPRSTRIRENWVRQFERYGVSATFEHDHHNYKRTHPIRNDQRDDENGIVYLGDGAWGVGNRTVPDVKDVWYLAHADARRHLYEVVINPDGKIQVRAMDAEGKVFDQTELHRARTQPVTP